MDEKKTVALIDYANQLYSSLRQVQTAYRTVWLERARLFREIKQSKCYKYIHGNGYETWEDFCKDPAVGMSRVQANLHIAIYEYYIEQLRLEPKDIEDISMAKLEIILINKDKMTVEEQATALTEAKLLSTSDFYENFKERVGLKDNKPNIYFNKEVGGWVIEFDPDTQFKIVDKKENKIIWQNSLLVKLS